MMKRNGKLVMTREEALEVLKSIPVAEYEVANARRVMLDKLVQKLQNGLYRKQGGCDFEFHNGHVAWLKAYGVDDGGTVYRLTERGELLYEGTSATKCAETLLKIGKAHRLRNDFLECW